MLLEPEETDTEPQNTKTQKVLSAGRKLGRGCEQQFHVGQTNLHLVLRKRMQQEGQQIMRSVSEGFQAPDIHTEPVALQGVHPACSNALFAWRREMPHGLPRTFLAHFLESI